MKDGFRVETILCWDQFGSDLRIGMVKEGKIYVAKPITLTFELFDQYGGQKIPPTLHLEDDMIEAFRRCFMAHGQEYLEGKLIATKEHLAYLQKLLESQLEVKKNA
jgi:hypothetical protein